MAPAWSEADIPDLNGVTAVVTGANRGIGLEVVRGLATKRAHVVLAVRRPESGEAAAASLRAVSPRASLEVMRLDLADLASVHRFAEALGSRLGMLEARLPGREHQPQDDHDELVLHGRLLVDAPTLITPAPGRSAGEANVHANEVSCPAPG
jgi:NAD(P)-dependent dehydrogenase (short-subunit alcohol dehydrogenase family)